MIIIRRMGVLRYFIQLVHNIKTVRSVLFCPRSQFTSVGRSGEINHHPDLDGGREGWERGVKIGEGTEDKRGLVQCGRVVVCVTQKKDTNTRCTLEVLPSSNHDKGRYRELENSRTVNCPRFLHS